MSKVLFAITDNLDFLDKGAEKVVWIHNIDSDNVEKSLFDTCIHNHLPNVYASTKDYQLANDYCTIICNKLVDYYSPILNDVNNCKYRSNEWKIFLFAWMYYFVTSLYDKYLNFKQMMSICSDFYIISKRSFHISKDTHEFVRKILFDGDYNIILYSELMLFFHQSVIDKEGCTIESLFWEKTGDGKCCKLSSNLNTKKTIKQRIKERLFFRKCKTYISAGGYLLGRNWAELLTLGRVRSGEDVYYTISDTCKIDSEAREKLCVNPDSNDEFFNFIASILGKHIPESVIEFFLDLSKLSRTVYPQSANKIIDSNSCYFNELLKRFAMDVKAAGGSIRIVLHGGGPFYGPIDAKIPDIVYSWGYGDGSSRYISMPAAKLLSYNKVKPRSGNYYLYTDYPLEMYPCTFDEGIHRDARLHKDTILSFFRYISDEVARKFLCRLIPDDYGYHMEMKLNQLHRPIEFDDYYKNDYYDRVSHASLVITTALETVWIEAIYIGVPLIVLCPKELISVIPTVEKYVTLLEQVSILVHDPFEAARLLESISGHEVEWWNEPDRQKVIKEIKSRFAYTPPFSTLRWIKEMCS